MLESHGQHLVLQQCNDQTPQKEIFHSPNIPHPRFNLITHSLTQPPLHPESLLRTSNSRFTGSRSLFLSLLHNSPLIAEIKTGCII